MATAIASPDKIDNELIKFSDNEKRDYLSSIQGYKKIDHEGYKMSVIDNFDGTFDIIEYDPSGKKITGRMENVSVDDAYSYIKNGFIQKEATDKAEAENTQEEVEDQTDEETNQKEASPTFEWDVDSDFRKNTNKAIEESILDSKIELEELDDEIEGIQKEIFKIEDLWITI